MKLSVKTVFNGSMWNGYVTVCWWQKKDKIKAIAELCRSKHRQEWYLFPQWHVLKACLYVCKLPNVKVMLNNKSGNTNQPNKRKLCLN